MDSLTKKTYLINAAAIVILVTVAAFSLFVGKYPLTVDGVLGGDEMMAKVFWNLRFPRIVLGVVGGFALGVTGFVFQTVFRNPLASPDIIGVSSGASAGAAAGILFLGGTFGINLAAFAGAILAVVFALGLASLDRTGRNSTIVLAGIVVHSLAQTVLMILKIMADPEKELASIEYWIMGSLNGIRKDPLIANIVIVVISLVVLFLLHRQMILLAGNEDEAKLLGVPVRTMRLLVLTVATLAVAATISLTGLISFLGLLAPHLARLLTRNNRQGTMFLSGVMGGIILTLADILARSAGSHELPVSIFTSLIGAPFLIFLIVREKRNDY